MEELYQRQDFELLTFPNIKNGMTAMFPTATFSDITFSINTLDIYKLHSRS